MAGGHPKVSDNVMGEENAHFAAWGARKGAPETRVPQQDLRDRKACASRRRQESFKKSWLRASLSTGERLLASVLIARKQPAAARDQSASRSPCRQACAANQTQAGPVASLSGAEARGAHCHGGSSSPSTRGRPAWAPRRPPESVSSHKFAFGPLEAVMETVPPGVGPAAPKGHELMLGRSPRPWLGAPGRPWKVTRHPCASLLRAWRPGGKLGLLAQSASLLFFWALWLQSPVLRV